MWLSHNCCHSFHYIIGFTYVRVIYLFDSLSEVSQDSFSLPPSFLFSFSFLSLDGGFALTFTGIMSCMFGSHLRLSMSVFNKLPHQWPKLSQMDVSLYPRISIPANRELTQSKTPGQRQLISRIKRHRNINKYGDMVLQRGTKYWMKLNSEAAEYQSNLMSAWHRRHTYHYYFTTMLEDATDDTDNIRYVHEIIASKYIINTCLFYLYVKFKNVFWIVLMWPAAQVVSFVLCRAFEWLAAKLNLQNREN